jgi:hypothetical protein
MLTMLPNILFALLLVVLPFGELLRFYLGNSIVVSGLDCIIGCIFLWSLFQYIKNKNYFSHAITKPIILFIVACVLSLLMNIHLLVPSQLITAFLYLFRWIALAGIYFFVASFSKEKKKSLLLWMTVSGGAFCNILFIQI